MTFADIVALMAAYGTSRGTRVKRDALSEQSSVERLPQTPDDHYVKTPCSMRRSTSSARRAAAACSNTPGRDPDVPAGIPGSADVIIG
jgi:hypothetical protein